MNQFTQDCILNRHEDLDKLEKYIANKAITHQMIMCAIRTLKNGGDLK
jgi:hypothetical protein